jgi:ethanolamine ammonia-lyase small subunit
VRSHPLRRLDDLGYAVTKVADQLFAAIENSEISTVRRLWADDVAVWRTGARRDTTKNARCGW